MKALKILSIVFLLAGFLLIVLAYVSRIQHWPDVFRGLYSGPILMIIGVILFIPGIKKG